MMTESSPGEQDSSDVSTPFAQASHSALEVDVDEPADSSNESALLADDPLNDNEIPPLVLL